MGSNPHRPRDKPLPADRDQAEEAKARANDKSTREFAPVSVLCPACNEPATRIEPNPNEYIHDDEQGEFRVDQAAYEFSPAELMDATHDNPWDAVHIVPETVEFDDGVYMRVHAYKHDYTTDAYAAWCEEMEALDEWERRAEENKALGDFA